MSLFGGLKKLVTSVVKAPLKAVEVVVKDVAAGRPQDIFKDEFKQTKADLKEQVKGITEVGKEVTHVATKAIRLQSSLDSQLVGTVGKAFGHGYLGEKLQMVSQDMKRDGEQLGGAMDDVADGEAKLAEDGKFFDFSAQNAERKRINNQWVKDRVVYDDAGNPHVIKGLGGKAATALSVASVFVPVLAPFAAAANAANAANNGNWKGAALSAISYFAPVVQTQFATAFGASESAVGQALANAAAKGVINGASTAVMGGNFGQGFLNGAATSVAGSLADGVISQVQPHLDALPPQLQKALTDSIKTSISGSITGQHAGASVEQQLVTGLAGYLGTQGGAYLGLNASTSQLLGTVAKQVANGKGGQVDLAAVALALFKDPKVSQAFSSMVNTGVTAVTGGAPANHPDTVGAMLTSGLPYLPENDVQAAPPLPPDQEAYTLGGFAPAADDVPATFEA